MYTDFTASKGIRLAKRSFSNKSLPQSLLDLAMKNIFGFFSLI